MDKMGRSVWRFDAAAVEWHSRMNSFYNGERRICNGLCRPQARLGAADRKGLKPWKRSELPPKRR
ncbi:hypothetical protein ABTW76_02435 [Paenibacillus dendritiformis]